MLIILIALFWILLNQHRGVQKKNGLIALGITIAVTAISTAIQMMLM